MKAVRVVGAVVLALLALLQWVPQDVMRRENQYPRQPILWQDDRWQCYLANATDEMDTYFFEERQGGGFCYVDVPKQEGHWVKIERRRPKWGFVVVSTGVLRGDTLEPPVEDVTQAPVGRILPAARQQMEDGLSFKGCRLSPALYRGLRGLLFVSVFALLLCTLHSGRRMMRQGRAEATPVEAWHRWLFWLDAATFLLILLVLFGEQGNRDIVKGEEHYADGSTVEVCEDWLGTLYQLHPPGDGIPYRVAFLPGAKEILVEQHTEWGPFLLNRGQTYPVEALGGDAWPRDARFYDSGVESLRQRMAAGEIQLRLTGINLRKEVFIPALLVYFLLGAVCCVSGWRARRAAVQ